MLLILLLYSLLLQIGANFTNEESNISQFRKKSEDSSMSILLKTIDNLSDWVTRFSGAPSEEQCKSFQLTIGIKKFNFSRYPRGDCSYCCPVSNNEKYVTLYWTNKSNHGKITKLPLNYEVGALRALNFNNNLPTVIYVHGWSENGLDYPGRIIREAYLSRNEEYNLIFVEWKDLATLPWYVPSKNNTKRVAATVAKFLNLYIKTGEINVDKLHIIGFSFGAQIVGMIGKSVKNVPRITGLDVALPLYELNYTLDRLVKTDADFVDVIHTDLNLFGFHVSIGDADFYPNADELNHPGCKIYEMIKYNRLGLFGQCDHIRAVEFYAKSVRYPEEFPAYKCNYTNWNRLECQTQTKAYMGFSASKLNAKGDFYLKTKLVLD